MMYEVCMIAVYRVGQFAKTRPIHLVWSREFHPERFAIAILQPGRVDELCQIIEMEFVVA